MESPQEVALRLMNSGGRIPSEITTHHLSDDGITEILKKNEREVEIRMPNDANQATDGIVVARIHRVQWSIALEPLVQGISVNASFDSRPESAVKLPDKSYIFLRPNDSISFEDHDFSVVIELEGDGRSTKRNEASTPEVQVKSSNVEAETAAAEGDDDTDFSGDEDHLDRSQSTRSAHTPKTVTPATSRPTNTIELLAIKETPNHRAFTNSNGDDQLYSTAQAEPRDSNTIGDADSPSVKAQHRSNADSQIRASASLVDTFNDASSDGKPDDGEVEEILPTIGVNSGHAGNESATASQKVAKSTSGLDGPGLDSTTRNDEHQTEVEETGVLTFEPLDPHGQASEAAAGSKRKLSDVNIEDESEPVEVSKKQKLDSDSNLPMTPEDDEPSVSTDNVLSKKSKERLCEKRKPQRAPEDAFPRPTQASGDEIVVHTNSPEVVVNQRLQSETPSSSALSSTLTGKVPKILLSSDCKAQNKPTVKQLLRKVGAKTVDKVPSRATNFLCVVTKQHSLKSAKVLLSLVRGKQVITEQWLIESAEAGELLNPSDFVHEILEDSITHDRRRIFSGRHLLLTNALVVNYGDGWADIQEVAKEAGASEVDKVAFNKSSSLGDRDDVVFFGLAKGDNDVSRLIKDHGRTVYAKDLLTESIVAGELDLDNGDYKLSAAAPVKKGRRS